MARQSIVKSRSKQQKILHCHKAPVRPIGALWSVLSFLVSVSSLFAYFQPVWIVGKWPTDGATDRTVLSLYKPTSLTLGLLEFCQKLHDAQMYHCQSYDRLYVLKTPTSYVWNFTVVSFGIGTVILLLTSFVAILSLCCNDYRNSRIALYTGYLQVVCVLLMAFGLIMLPASFGTELLQTFCGPNSFAYHFGDCQIGWTYALAIMSTMLAIFCPFLARHTSFRSFNVDRFEIVLPKHASYRKLPTKEYYI